MKKHKKLIKALIIVVVLLLVAYFALSDKLLIRYYTIESDKIENHIRVVQISDLHSCYYGENQSELVDAVVELDPDIVVLTGDIFDDEIDNSKSEMVISALSDKYPLFYVSGNHDMWASREWKIEQRQILKDNHVRVLKEGVIRCNIKGEFIDIYGIQDPAAFVRKAEDNRRHDEGYVRGQMWQIDYVDTPYHYSILLAHRPEFQDIYDDWGFDLVLSGHTHGGVIRIPYIMNGLYAWGQGFFPMWSGGFYVLDNSLMIISRGLSRESSGKRVFNRPELVCIDIY